MLSLCFNYLGNPLFLNVNLRVVGHFDCHFNYMLVILLHLNYDDDDDDMYLLTLLTIYMIQIN